MGLLPWAMTFKPNLRRGDPVRIFVGPAGHEQEPVDTAEAMSSKPVTGAVLVLPWPYRGPMTHSVRSMYRLRVASYARIMSPRLLAWVSTEVHRPLMEPR